MSTFLEYLLARYLGNPDRRCGQGVSYWPCPVCGSSSFHTMPDLPHFRHRAKCHGSYCGFRGDAADMLREFHPDEPYGDRRDRLEHIRREWSALVAGGEIRN